MGKLNRMSMVWDAIGTVADLVKEWKPRDCRTEAHFEKSLYDFLMDNSKGIDVVRQYGKGRARVDIAVDDQVFIEVKLNLDTTDKYHKLVGQIESYLKKGLDNLIVVLCGSSDKGLVHDLNSHIANYDGGIIGETSDVRIVSKSA